LAVLGPASIGYERLRTLEEMDGIVGDRLGWIGKPPTVGKDPRGQLSINKFDIIRDRLHAVAVTAC
jgi:hypothetical protein